jgi:hypothetical protein
MANSQSVSLLGPEFDDFLFAPIGEEKNGMLLRVVSALARLDLDPWQEAANLARLPRPAATERLTEFIVALSGGPSTDLDSKEVAAGLIARLPLQPGSNAPSAEHPGGFGIPASIHPHFFFYLALVLMFLLDTLAFAGSPPSKSPTNNAAAPTAGKVLPQSASATGAP